MSLLIIILVGAGAYQAWKIIKLSDESKKYQHIKLQLENMRGSILQNAENVKDHDYEQSATIKFTERMEAMAGEIKEMIKEDN